jgi:sterol desaturase/sphingolipid hydroxylase (fatty acid hydroxylase superfamily)
MEFLHRLANLDTQYLIANFRPGGPYGLPSILGALALTWFLFARRRRAEGRPYGAKAFLGWLLPRKILAHRSTLVDAKLWIFNAGVLGFTYAWVAISGRWVSEQTTGLFVGLFGEHAPTPWPLWLTLGLTSVLILLAYELAYWFGHFLFHRYAFLWEFHKVHHSAEVMTTLTELRQHPIEILAFINLIAVSTGVTLGALTYAFGPGAHSLTLFNANLLLLLFLMTWGHLRHTHIWWSFTGLAGRLFQSPAHHQLHHSDNPAHWDRNLGFALALYDWLFGTLMIPDPDKHVQNVRFGIGDENGIHDSLSGAFLLPFVRSAQHLGLIGKATEPTAPVAAKRA